MKLYPRTIKSMLWGFIRVAALVYAVLLVALIFFQERLIFHPTGLSADHQFQFSQYKDQTIEEHWFAVDGKQIDTLLFHVADSAGVILYFHGNQGNIETYGARIEELAHRSRYDVWILDYPGFGKSEGTIASEKELHDGSAALWAAASEKYAGRPVVLFGRSIGTGIAAHLAVEHPPAGLILESPYMSLVAMAGERFPWVPVALLHYELHSDQWIPRVVSPVLVFHGTADHTIPFKQGEALAKLSGKAEFVSIEGGHHNDLDLSKVYWEKLLGWLKVRAGLVANAG